MFKKFISMATAVFLMASGLSVLATQASATSTTITINCSNTALLTDADGWEDLPVDVSSRYPEMGPGRHKFLVLNPSNAYTFNTTNCSSIRPNLRANSTPGTITLTGSNVNNGSATNATISGGFSPNNFVATGGSTIPTLPIGSTRSSITFEPTQGSTPRVTVTFIDSVTGANADLAQLTTNPDPRTPLSGFSPSTTTYNLTTTSSTFGTTRTTPSIDTQPVIRSCNGTLMATNSFDCALTLGANVFTASITSLDRQTTKVYTVNITRNARTAAVINSSSTIAVGAVNPSIVIQTASGSFTSDSTNNASNFSGYVVNVGTTGLTRGTATVSGGNLTIPFTGTARAGTLTFRVNENILGEFDQSNTLSFVVSPSELPACNADLLSSSSTIKGVTITRGQSRSSAQFSDFYTPGPLRGSVTLTEAQASGSGTTSLTATDGSPVYWLYIAPGINSFSHENISGTDNHSSVSFVNGRDFIVRVVPTACAAQYYWFTINVGSSTPAPSTPAEIAAAAAAQAAAAAAAARAAEAAAAAIRAAEIATAQTSLATVLRGDKAGSLSEYRAANINITTTAALTRLNAEVLKLSAADRADFAKIKAIADKIEFDESFFNATARPSIATYTTYGVTGVTERILPVINAKVLELPAALRADVKAMQELVKVESFVDRVANPSTRSTVSAAALVSRGLLVADYPRRYSVVRGLGAYPEGSLNTMAKIEAAIKAEIAKAEAPKLRLAEIKARIAARKK